MKLKKITLMLLVFGSILFAQEKATLSGIITDKSNGETLFGASVYLKNTTIGVLTNEYGFYSISAPKGAYTLIVSFLGYNSNSKEIELDKDQKFDFELSENATQLEEVIILLKQKALILEDQK